MYLCIHSRIAKMKVMMMKVRQDEICMQKK